MTLKELFHSKSKTVAAAAVLLGGASLVSRLVGIWRDRLLSGTFGAGPELDAYYAAFRIPDLIFVSVASLVSISVLVPFFIEKLREGEEEGKRFIDATFSVFFVVIIAVCFVVFFAMPTLIPLVLPGFASDPLLSDLIGLARILLLSPLLLGISNFLASITQIYNRFLIYAVSPLLYNLGIIAGIWFFYPALGIAGLGWGVVLGALLHVGIQVPFIRSQRLFPVFRLPLRWALVKRVVLISLPRTLTLSANQIATFFLVALASLLSAGSIAVFNFSWNLQSVPLSIIAVSYASAVFPALSRLAAEGKTREFIVEMALCARHIIFWSLPAMALFVVLRAQIVRTILGAGNFDWSDTRLTAAALAIFVLSVVPQSLLLLFIRGYYALGRTTRPLIINVISSVCIVLLGYGLLYFASATPVFRYFVESLFKVENLSGSSVLLLALAYTIGTAVNAVWHFAAFQFEFPDFKAPVVKTFFESFSASVIMGYASYLFLDVFDNIFNLSTLPGIFLQGFCSGLLGIAIGVLVLRLMKSEELSEVWRTLHRKIWKAPVIVPDTNENSAVQ